MENHDKENSFALKSKLTRIHISEAESGRNDYYCTSCEAEMQAVKSRLANRISYFRHDPKDVERRKNCTYSDKEERFKVAAEILIRLKKVKVPALYKYPAKEVDGPPLKLASSKFVEAFKVGTNLYFYEDRDGNIHWGGQCDAPELEFLFRADVVFLSQRETPILLIEFVENHKRSNDDAKVKLKRLGIDAVQIRILRESPQEIEKQFSQTDNIKWSYNYEQERAQYISISGTHPESISPIDDIQRDFFGDNFNCKQAEIRNLIRSIAKCLGSKYYRETLERIQLEIDRVDQESIKIAEQFTDLQTRAKEDIRREYSTEEESIRARREELSGQEKRLAELNHKLENRYLRKKAEIETERGEFESRIDKEFREKGTRGSTLSERKRAIANQIAGVEGDIKSARESIDQVQRDSEALSEKFRKEEEDLAKSFEFEEAELERNETESINRIRARDSRGIPELPDGLQTVADIRRFIFNVIERQSSVVRRRAAWKSLRSGAFKNWND
jgi:hypothetical protein